MPEVSDSQEIVDVNDPESIRSAKGQPTAHYMTEDGAIPFGAIRLGSGHHILKTSDGNYIWKDPNCRAYNLVDVTSGKFHTLVSEKPLHIEASLLCPQGCGAHGFVREGKWVQA